MSFGSSRYTNSGNNKPAFNKNTTSTGLEFFNPDAEIYGSKFTTGFWNGYISLKINPALAKSKRTPNKIYDYDSSLSVLLTPAEALAISKAAREELIPKMIEDPNGCTEIGLTTKDMYIGIGNGIKYTEGIQPYVVIYRVKDKKATDEQMIFVLNQTPILKNYNHIDGTYDFSRMDAELELLVAGLEYAAKAFMNTAGHLVKKEQKWTLKRINDILDKMGSSMGISVDSSGAGYKGSSNTSSGFSFDENTAANEEVAGSINEVYDGIDNDEVPF